MSPGRLFIGAAVAAAAVFGATQVVSGSTANTDETVFVGMTPTRVLDTRQNASTFDGSDEAVGRRGAGTTYELGITGRGSIPGAAVSVTANLVAVYPGTNGYLTVYPWVAGGLVVALVAVFWLDWRRTR